MADRHPLHTSSPRFPFKAASERLSARYPKEMANLVWVNGCGEDSLEKVQAFLKDVSPEYLGIPSMAEAPGFIRDMLIANKAFDLLAGGCRYFPDEKKNKAMAIVHTEHATDLIKDPLKDIHNAMAHEAAHHLLEYILISSGPVREINESSGEISADGISGEIGSDSFANMDGLSQGKEILEWKDVTHLTLIRALTAWLEGGITHATTPAMNHLMARYGNTDFTALADKPYEIKRLAEYHARRHGVTAADVEEAVRLLSAIRPKEVTGIEKDNDWGKKDFGLSASGLIYIPEESEETRDDYEQRVAEALQNGREPQSDRQKWLTDLVDACKKSSRDSITYHVTATILTELINTGKLDFPVEREFDITKDFRRETSAMLTVRAREVGMEKILTPRDFRP